jgi:hypothetical protein
MAPRGYPNFNSYVKNPRDLVFQKGGDINLVWASLTTFLQVTPAVRGLEELFSTVLDRFLQPIYFISACVLQELGW